MPARNPNDPKLPLDRFGKGINTEREERPVATKAATVATTVAERELRVAEAIHPQR